MASTPITRIATYRHWPGVANQWLVLCDHASNRVPAELRDLGLSAYELGRHIAWDIGAADVAQRLARGLRAPYYAHGISRLVADPNRQFADPSLIPALSDHTQIPGNAQLDDSERRRRWEHYHQPYHRRISRHLNRMAAIGCKPVIVSVHSFTPEMNGKPRDWPIGVLWRDDPRFAHALIRELARDGTRVGNNQPYDGHELIGYTSEVHAIGRGLPYATIELRQDLLTTPAARARYALKLLRALQACVHRL